MLYQTSRSGFEHVFFCPYKEHAANHYWLATTLHEMCLQETIFMFVSAKVTALQPNHFCILWSQLLITIYNFPIILSYS